MPSPIQPMQDTAQAHAAAPDFSKLSTRLRYLRDDMLRLRYFSRNVEKAKFAFSTINYKAMLRKYPARVIYLLPLLILRKLLLTLDSIMPESYAHYEPLTLYLRAKFYTRFLLGKLDMPYFELVLTTRCSLRCESCNNLMQYFDSKTAYTCSLEGITRALQELIKHVDSISWVRIIGGEPLLFKDIDKVVTLLDSMPKVKTFDIVTNGTIIPKPALLDALSKSHKSWVSISDYTKSPNLDIKLHIEKITQTLDAHHIRNSCLWQDENTAWFAPGKIYKRNRTREGIVRNFRACLMQCVSVMSHEDILKGTDSRANDSSAQNSSMGEFKNLIGGGAAQSAGEMFLCPIASSLSRLKGLKEFSGDFVSLDSTCNRYKIMQFYAQDFFHACDYCHDMDKPKEYIPIARQTKATLALEP